MDTLVLQQFLKELIFMSSTVISAYFLVGAFVWAEERLKRAIIQSALK